jgi:hypothetical protein
MSFDQFIADMGPAPDGQTLERIDNNGPYTAANCRWASPTEQANNRRSTRLITFNGRTQSLTQWAREIGVTDHRLRSRIDRLGWPIARALATSADGRRHSA